MQIVYSSRKGARSIEHIGSAHEDKLAGALQRLVLENKKIVDIGQPKRGDVMVFRYSVDPSKDYIKRVIGLPSDTVAYQNKRLTINGRPVKTRQIKLRDRKSVV